MYVILPLHTFSYSNNFLVLEERAVYYRETKNGLYSTFPFILSNTIVNIPYLFICTIFFTLICYWAIVSFDNFQIPLYVHQHLQGLHAGGAAFFRFVAFLFLAILAAESQVLVIAALLPVFVAALAIGAL